MTVRLHLRRIRVVGVVRDDEAELVVEVADTQSVKRCPACGGRTATVHETRRRRVRDLPSLGRPTTLVVQVRRYECRCGHRFTPEHPELAGKLTRRLARTLVVDVRKLTTRELARRHRLGWHLIMGVVRAWAETVAAQRRAERCRVLLVDETSLRRGHRYVTVLLNGETGAVLAIVRHRDARALASFFIEQGRRWCRGVEVVVTDGSESYTAAIGWHLPRATHILDRFHVVRWFARGLIEVRRHLQRPEPPGVTPVFDPEVFRARFLALKRADRLDDAERARLQAIFAARAELARAWSMLQELYGLYAAQDLAGADQLDGSGNGGTLRISFRKEPTPTVEFTIDPVNPVNTLTGKATIKGTYRCTKGRFIMIPAGIDQEAAPGVSVGSWKEFYAQGTCDGRRRVWTVKMDTTHFTGGKFVAGPALVNASARACGVARCTYSPGPLDTPIQQMVRLRPRG